MDDFPGVQVRDGRQQRRQRRQRIACIANPLPALRAVKLDGEKLCKVAKRT